MSAVHFSSADTRWSTPRALFADLHEEFGFTIDVCASSENSCLPRFWTERDEALMRSWEGERVWMNPPYGRQIGRWLEKAHTESGSADLIVALLPSRTDTAWWHDYVMGCDQIRFLRRRLEFGVPTATRPEGNKAPFPSCLAIWEALVGLPE